MCLTIDTKVHKKPEVRYKPLTAKKDITTYKIVLKPNSYRPKDKKKRAFHAMVRSFKYELRRLYTARFSFGIGNDQVYAGLHSYTKESTIIKMNTGYRPASHNRNELLECVIPKGTKYYTGISGDLVSTALYIKRVVNTSKHPDFKPKKKVIK